jgi:hypothetical protein
MEDGNDKFFALLTVFIGIMAGVVKANNGIKSLTGVLEKETFKKLSTGVLAKTGILFLAKIAAEKISEKLFWHGYFNMAAKIVPLIGGVVTGGTTLATFLPMAKRLNNELRKIIEK